MLLKRKNIASYRSADRAADDARALQGMRAFLRGRDGAAMIEFGLVFWIFISFFLFMFEFCLIMWGNMTINNVITQAARKGMVGCIANNCTGQLAVNPADLRREIVEASGGIIQACDGGRFKFEVAPVGGVPSPDGFSPGSVNLGLSQEIVAYKTSYEWKVFFPFLRVESLFGPFVNYEVAILVRNEPFGNNYGTRTGGSGGC